jgi:hypothetical protein
MNADMIITGIMLVGTVLSFTFLLRARRLSVELWSAKSSSQCSSIGSDVACPVDMNLECRGQER